MERAPTAATSQPISLGLTCWIWELGVKRAMQRIAKRNGVNLRLGYHLTLIPLQYELLGHVSGPAPQVDSFLSAFALLA